MENQYTIPKRCNQCNTLFDLKYEVKDIDSLLNEPHHLCWECNENKPLPQQTQDDSEDDSILDFDVEFE